MVGVLGVSLGTRTVGYAVVKNSLLINYGLLSFMGSWNSHKCNKICSSIKTIATRHGCTSIIIKVPQLHYSDNLKEIISHLEKSELCMKTVTINELKTSNKETITTLMREFVERYPQLTYAYKKEMKQRKKLKSNPYYQKLFEAVACACRKVEL